MGGYGYGAPNTSGPLQQGFPLKTGQPSLWQRLRLTQWLGNARAPIFADPSEVGTQGVPSSLDPRSPYEQFTGESSPNYGDFSSYKRPPFAPAPAAVPSTTMADLGYREDPAAAHALIGGFSRGEMTIPEKSQINPTDGAGPATAAKAAAEPNTVGHDHRMFFERNPNAGKQIGLGALGALLGAAFGGDLSMASGMSQGLAKTISGQDEFNRQALESDRARADQQAYGLQQLAEQARLREGSAQADYMRGRRPTMYNGQELNLRDEDIAAMGHQKVLEDIARQQAENDKQRLGDPEMTKLEQEARIKRMTDPSASNELMAAMMPQLGALLGQDPATRAIRQRLYDLVSKERGLGGSDKTHPLEALDKTLASFRTTGEKLKFLNDTVAELSKRYQSSKDPVQQRQIQEMMNFLRSRQQTAGQ